VRDISTAVGSRSDRGPLGASSEKVKKLKTCCQSTFANNRSREVDRNLGKGLESLLVSFLHQDLVCKSETHT
jgi:hypothetical protein